MNCSAWFDADISTLCSSVFIVCWMIFCITLLIEVYFFDQTRIGYLLLKYYVFHSKDVNSLKVAAFITY